jgi:hypothetical protein
MFLPSWLWSSSSSRSSKSSTPYYSLSLFLYGPDSPGHFFDSILSHRRMKGPADHSHRSGLLPPPPADDDDEKEEKDCHNADILAQPISAFHATVCLALVLPTGRRKQGPSRYHFDRSIDRRRHHGPWTDSNKNNRANNIGNSFTGGPTAMRPLAKVAATTFFPPVLEWLARFVGCQPGYAVVAH